MYQIDPRELYALRMLVFIEVSPQSNKYRQVILKPEQFKKVSEATIKEIISQDGDDQTVTHELGDQIYTLPDLQEIQYD